MMQKDVAQQLNEYVKLCIFPISFPLTRHQIVIEM